MRREDSFAMFAGRALNTKIVLRLTSAQLGASHVDRLCITDVSYVPSLWYTMLESHWLAQSFL